MSFGFKKKLLPSNKKNVVNNSAKEKEAKTTEQYGNTETACATVYSNPNCLEMEINNGDDNGNTGKLHTAAITMKLHRYYFIDITSF